MIVTIKETGEEKELRLVENGMDVSNDLIGMFGGGKEMDWESYQMWKQAFDNSKTYAEAYDYVTLEYGWQC